MTDMPFDDDEDAGLWWDNNCARCKFGYNDDGQPSKCFADDAVSLYMAINEPVSVEVGWFIGDKMRCKHYAHPESNDEYPTPPDPNQLSLFDPESNNKEPIKAMLRCPNCEKALPKSKTEDSQCESCGWPDFESGDNDTVPSLNSTTTNNQSKQPTTMSAESAFVIGKITQLLPVESGKGKTGKDWQKQGFLVETQGQYPKKIMLEAFGDKPGLDRFREGDMVKVFIELESRSHNDRWYTTVRAYRIDHHGEATPASNNRSQQAQPTKPTFEQYYNDVFELTKRAGFEWAPGQEDVRADYNAELTAKQSSQMFIDDWSKQQ